eukprot:12666995-Ditylum_brightwellii.AAC.1
MDKESFDASSSTLKEFTETCVCYKEYKPKASEKTSAAHKIHSKRGGKCNVKCKVIKKAYHDWDQDSPQRHSD